MRVLSSADFVHDPCPRYMSAERIGTHLVKFASDNMYIGSYRPQVVISLFIADVASTYNLPNLAWHLICQ
jgi:hypothetical protein